MIYQLFVGKKKLKILKKKICPQKVEKNTLKSCSEKLKSTFFPLLLGLPKRPKPKNSCSKMWLIGQLNIKLGWRAGIYSNCCLCCSIFLLVASNTFLGVGTQGDMFTQIYLISHLLSCSCSHFFLCSGTGFAILNRRKMCVYTIETISIAGADNYCHTCMSF